MKPCTVDSVLLAALEQFEYTKLPIGSYLLRWRKLRGTTQKEDVKKTKCYHQLAVNIVCVVVNDYNKQIENVKVDNKN